MRVNRQLSSIVALVAVQVILFVFYSFRFHRGWGIRQRAGTLQLLQQQQQEQQFSVWSTDNTSDRGVSGDGGKTATDVGYTIATGVDSSTGNDRTSVSRTPVSAVSTTANVSIVVRNSTRQLVAGRLAYETSTLDFGTDFDSADSNVTHGRGGAGILKPRGSNRLYATDKKLIFLKKPELGDDCELQFLQRYSTYCEKAIVPHLEMENSTLCPCVPRTLSKLIVFVTLFIIAL